MCRLPRYLSFIGIILLIMQYINCDCFYTIVAPNHIRPHSDYKAAITIHNNNNIQPIKIRLSIESFNYMNSKDVMINPNSTNIVTLRINDLDATKRHNLIARGLSGINLTEISDLEIVSKNVSIFIQTDKAIYKPTEWIKFRILVLDNELKPIDFPSYTQLNILLTDAANNRIKQWFNAKPYKGIYTDQIQLSSLPILGVWKFYAQIGNEKKTKEIEIAKYVLPKFDVLIDSANVFSIKDGKIRAIIRAQYTYGKMVKGDAIISLTPYSTYSSIQFPKCVKKIQINGKGTVEFDIEKDLNDFYFDKITNQMLLNMTASVNENITGHCHSMSKEITIHELRYKIERELSDHEFKPGYPIKLSINVKRIDGSPIVQNNHINWITIKKTSERSERFDNASTFDDLECSNCYMDDYIQCVSPRRNKMVQFFDFMLSEKGTADIEIPTSEQEDMIKLMAKYIDEEEHIGYLFANSDFEELSDFDTKLLTQRPKLNKMVSVEVLSEDVLQSLTYYVIGRGRIVYVENVSIFGTKRYVISFNATFDLFPKATVIAYYFQRDNIIATSIDIPIEDDFKNFIQLKLSRTEIEPGKDINIDIHTNRDSHVGIVGIDQSVSLLKINNGLTQMDIIHEMNDYQNVFYENDKSTMIEFDRTEYNDDYFQHFENNKLILLTNARKDFYYQLCKDELDSEYHDELNNANTKKNVASEATQSIRVRTEFPETWLWEDFDINSPNGTLSLTKRVPDTITSWVISAFSINLGNGLALTKSPKSLKVFQPFFVSLSLPYSVKRGEVVAIPVVLFNHLATDITADLTLHNENDEFEFIEDVQGEETIRQRQLLVPTDSGVSTTFLVRFTTIGKIPLKVSAISDVAGDAAIRIIQVDPEGVPQFINKALFVDLRETDTFEAIQNIEVPVNAVPGSLKINVNAIGDLLGGTIQNLDELIRLPMGCGEQNMLNFVPDIVILDYLTAKRDFDREIKDKALKFMETGYQRELAYRHNDGSFSVFGKSDRIGSTWLTAFVAKAFKQANSYIDIDSEMIEEALKFLNSTQASDGSFPEIGHIYDHAMQGGTSNGVALTAYVTISFLMNKEIDDWKYQDTIDKAINNIIANLDAIDDTYALAIAAYALQLANHSQRGEVLDNLLLKSIVKDSDEHKYWTKSKPGSHGSRSISIDVEITSYGVLALVESKRHIEILPYFRWLLAQRTDKGGFFGTQDTVIGLEALAAYARIISVKNSNIQLKIQTDTINDRLLNVKSSNALVLQTLELPPNTSSVHLTATGHGFTLFQLSYRYNLNHSNVKSSFDLKPKLLETTSGRLNLEICSKFSPENDEDKHSNMVVVEVSMPSGFLIDKDDLNDLLKNPHVKLVEMKNGETVADIYIDQMAANEEICLVVQGFRSHEVTQNKPIPVRIYDYYDSSRNAQEFYEMPITTACDICESGECVRSCGK